uniref:Uncharacterized protein n=1 Tax=Phlebotomus papatasi TaxID=29031 RepID=A0A1B0DRA3_PHLPP
MKIIFAILLVFGLAIGPAVSQNAVLGQFPSHAGLVFLGRFCDATVLNNRHVLTAATCGLSETNERLAVGVYSLFVGVINIPAGTAGSIGISQFYIHEEYNPFYEHWNNIAVFRTAADIPINSVPPAAIIEPVEIYDRIVYDGLNCVLVGWNSAPSVSGSLLDSMVCAGTLTTNPMQCPNNPGGALYCRGALFAIMSHNRICGQPNAPGVYTQLRFFEDWIARQLNRTDTPPPGPTHAPGHPAPPVGDTGSALMSSLFILVSLLALRFLA